MKHIKGSYLKEQYLEAFLVQSAYIEGLLKTYCDFNFWKEFQKNIKEKNKMTLQLRKRVKRLGLNELIEFLHKSDLIDDTQRDDLHTYREKRNQVLHDLVKSMSNEEFEKELKEVCEIGDKIIDDKKFQRIEKIIDSSDELDELIKKKNEVKQK